MLKAFYRRRLPHLQRDAKPHFVTFCTYHRWVLPETVRAHYAQHMQQLTDRARQLIIALTYDQRLLAGPPFSVDGAEIARLYQPAYALTLLGSADVVGGLKGKCPAAEDVWLLTP